MTPLKTSLNAGVLYQRFNFDREVENVEGYPIDHVFSPAFLRMPDLDRAGRHVVLDPDYVCPRMMINTPSKSSRGCGVRVSGGHLIRSAEPRS